jgi:hypothetical protein
MKKLIKTAAVLLMPTAMFAQIDGPFPLAQIDGPHSHDRDSICINRIELANIIDDLMEVDSWLNEDKFNGRHVCEHTQALLVEVIGRLHGEFQEQSLTN